MRHLAKGFTLTEAAVVLGITGLVLGAVWYAVSTAYEGIRIAKAQRQFTTLSQNLMKLGNQGSLSTTAALTASTGTPGWFFAGDMNSSLVLSGAVPTDMIDPATGAIINPWTNVMAGQPNAVILTVGTYSPTDHLSWPAGLSGIPAGAGTDSFEIMYAGISTDACIKLALSLTGPSRDPAIVSVFMNDWTAGGGVQAFPITLEQASPACSSATNGAGGPANGGGGGGAFDGTASIDVVYKFK